MSETIEFKIVPLLTVVFALLRLSNVTVNISEA